MAGDMRIGLISFGPAEFAALHETCVMAGHDPVVYAFSRSMRPRTPTDEGAATVAARIAAAVPPGVDLLLPGSSAGLGTALRGYDLDLVVCYGFSWRLPRSVLEIPRYGVLNIHSSMLPKYRGPAPVLQAIRNGDTHLGLTVHRMDEDFDTGPVLAQQDGIPLPDDVTQQSLWSDLSPVLRDQLTIALDRVRDPTAGEPQTAEGASYAGFLEPEFFTVDTAATARQVHDQVRTFRFMGTGLGPVVTVGGHRLRVLRTSLSPADGIRLDCADGAVWITSSEPAPLDA
ncbi:formyltransferase family protein [Actinacidiphila sp. DG2A-62]|uniref:methionyl-tRNA formyltransferase n=1 Tax=Actinacidiphila sp. DG2A-62 TaxID=3108821 RepID=UPI002DB961C8|nr:formyltransferase family protein [Actinacidiphila sp. DG2A-62]MEC3995824.1 formyltransferase family protein [Actinacidiphila sp. DG2A-62]